MIILLLKNWKISDPNLLMLIGKRINTGSRKVGRNGIEQVTEIQNFTMRPQNKDEHEIESFV